MPNQSKFSTVKDIDGNVLRLGATRLIEDHSNQKDSEYRNDWAATYAAIRLAVKNKNNVDRIRVKRVKINDSGTPSLEELSLWVDFYMKPSPHFSTIGCRKFSAYNFRKILQAAGATRKTAKAKAAKAGA
jgi:hypothetical protein